MGVFSINVSSFGPQVNPSAEYSSVCLDAFCFPGTLRFSLQRLTWARVGGAMLAVRCRGAKKLN